MHIAVGRDNASETKKRRRYLLGGGTMNRCMDGCAGLLVFER